MTTCPKCGYVRKPSETAPDWQCPSCGIAYAKFHAAPPAAAAAAAADAPAGAGPTDVSGGTGYDSLFVHVVLSGFALGFTWMIFTWSDNWLVYESFGPISGSDLGRVLAVAFDLYVVGSIFNSMLDQLGRPLRENRHRFAYAAGCVVVAFTLHFTGILTKVYTALGMTPPGKAASIGMLWSHSIHPSKPELPLEAFAGKWNGFRKGLPGIPHWGTGWISRVEVSVANGKASAHFWRSCPPQECDGGTYPAIIQTRHAGYALARCGAIWIGRGLCCVGRRTSV